MIALRRRYFCSGTYQGSMHSRTLLVIDVPRPSRTDQGLAELATRLKPDTIHYAQAHIGRDMGELPELLEQHEYAVKRLEKYLAVYLKNPKKLPEKRPTCKPKTKGHKVDAIDYYAVLSSLRHTNFRRNKYKHWKDKSKQLVKQSPLEKQLNMDSFPTPQSLPLTPLQKPQRENTSKEVPYCSPHNPKISSGKISVFLNRVERQIESLETFYFSH